MIALCGKRVKAHAQGRDEPRKRRTSSADLEEVSVAAASDKFHLCGMVSRDIGASGFESECLSLKTLRPAHIKIKHNDDHI